MKKISYIKNKISALCRLLLSFDYYLHTERGLNASFSEKSNDDIKKLLSVTYSNGKPIYKFKEKTNDEKEKI